MGIAIWSMHYTGMLAFHLPIPVRYHVPTTLLSFCIAVLGSAVGLHLVIREQFRWSKTTIAALFNGAGIVGLHFTSMASTRAAAVHQYDPVFQFGYLAQLWRQVEVLEARRPRRNDAHDDRVRAALLKDVDAEAAETGNAERKIG